MPHEGDPPFVSNAPGLRLSHVVQKRGDAQGIAACEPVGKRGAKGDRHHGCIPAEHLCWIALNPRHVAQHLVGMPQHIKVVIAALLHSPAVAQFRDEGREPSHVIKCGNRGHWVAGTDDARELLHHALPGCAQQPLGGGVSSAAGIWVNREAERISQAREPDDADGIVGERCGPHQHEALAAQVIHAPVMIDNHGITGHRERKGIHREVPPAQILIERLPEHRHDVHLPRQGATREPPCTEVPRQLKPACPMGPGERLGGHRGVA